MGRVYLKDTFESVLNPTLHMDNNRRNAHNALYVREIFATQRNMKGISTTYHKGCSYRKEFSFLWEKFLTFKSIPILEVTLGRVFQVFPGCA